MPPREIHLKRAYDPPAKDDGFRILVDRVWPRGVSKEKLDVDVWAKELAPSTELRKWFGHDAERWPEFRKRYEQELRESDSRERVAELVKAAKNKHTITLVYGAKDPEHNQAVVLGRLFERAL